MSKIVVNLLPNEIVIERVKLAKLANINRLSIGILVALVVLSAGIFSLRFTQNGEVVHITQSLAAEEQKITSLKDKESQVIVLKQRLGDISKLNKGDEKITDMMNLIVGATPIDVEITDVAISKEGNVTVTFSSPSNEKIEELIDNLLTQGGEIGLLSKINLEGVSLGKDGIYRFGMRITTPVGSTSTAKNG